MSEKMIISGSEFDASKDIIFTKPKVNNSGGKNVGILNSSSKKSLFISTPLMLTWGVNENDFDGSGKKTYDLSLQFPRDQDSNFTEETQELLDSLVKFENRIKEDAIANSKEWFNKPKQSADVIDALWTPMLKYPKDQNTGEPDTTRAPSLRVKIPYYDNVFKIELYDTDRQMIFPDTNNEDLKPMNLIEKGQNIAVVIQTGGIWFANGKFGTTWKLIQAMIQPRASLYGKCHIKLDKNDKDRLKQEATDRDTEENMNPENNVNSSSVVDSDDDEKVTTSEEVVNEGVVDSKQEAPVEEKEEPVVKKRRPIKKKKDESTD